MMSIHKINILGGVALLLGLCGCQSGQQGAGALFQVLDAAQTGIDFENTIAPDDTFNLMDFEYLYNGGGVGVGDFDQNGLPDLVFTGNQVKSRIYLNKGNFEFEDLTDASGLNTEGLWCTGVSVVDINSDGLDDLYICVGGPLNESIYPNRLYINQGDNTFLEAAEAYGLADPSQSNQAVFFDYDRDGDLDVYLLNGGGFEKSAVTIRPMLTNGSGRNTDRLYRNDFDPALGHAIYTNVSREAGITIEGFGLGASILDANADGWPDIYVGNDYLSRDLLYLNNQDGTFTEAAEAYFGHTSHFSMGNSVGDINNDGYLDLFTLDMLPESYYRRKLMFGPSQYDKFQRALQYGYGHQYMRNMLHLSNGQGQYAEIGQLAGVDRTDWSWAPLIADLDNDGFQDLFVTNGYGKDITDLDFVKFRKNAAAPFSSPDEVEQRVLKSLEEQPAISQPNYAYKNNGDHTFANKIKDWGFEAPTISNGAAYADLDQDGDLDLIINNIDQAAFIYRNTLMERDTAAGRYLQVQLSGPEGNEKGIGATVKVYAGEQVFTRLQQPVSGFQSTVTDVLHFGLGPIEKVDSLTVAWPDGKKSTLLSTVTNQRIRASYQTAVEVVAATSSRKAPLLKAGGAIPLQHQEPDYANDFKVQPLLQHGFTHQGPGMAVGDVNGDGLDDVVMGGAYGHDAQVMLQNTDGSFTALALPTKNYEDLGLLLFDADGDQDLDLYAASGGSERYAHHIHYQDRLYLNDGLGHFTLSTGRLPEMLSSTAAVAGSDFDADGDIDLFVGGRVVPGQYPKAPQSYLLQNNGGTFTEVTKEICPSLQTVGMVTAALWTDFNNDHQPDLIVVGELMKISVYQNTGTGLTDITDPAGLAQSAGMWNSITSSDFDRDGDMDYVVGNIGQNTPFKATPEHPLKLHYADFDQNGATDPVFSIYEEGEYYPLASLDLLTAQMPVLKKKVLRYKDFAQSTTSDILNILETEEMHTLQCDIQATVLLENLGTGQFKLHPLPQLAQVAPVKGIVCEDLDLDGDPDIILTGNEYNTEVVTGRYDALMGLFLRNEGGLRFHPLSSEASGLQISGDQRAAVTLRKADGEMALLVSTNGGAARAYALPRSGQKLLVFEPGEVSALLTYEGGQQQKIECHFGGGYLSQSTRSLRLSPQAKEMAFYDRNGKPTRTLNILALKAEL